MSCAIAQDIASPVPRAAGEPQPAAVPGVRLSDDGTRVIYEPEFFSALGAVTAIDILKRIPGIQDLLSFDDEDIRYASDISFVYRLNRRLDGTAFIEMRALPGVKAKLEVRRLFRSGAERNRSTFTGNRGFSPLLCTENRVAIFDRAIALTLSGNF